MSEREANSDWLKDQYGLDYEALDPEVQEIIEHLGEEGVRDLVEQVGETVFYRGERVTAEEKNNILQRVVRLGEEENGGRWAEGEPSIGGDKPKDWISDELDDLQEV